MRSKLPDGFILARKWSFVLRSVASLLYCCFALLLFSVRFAAALASSCAVVLGFLLGFPVRLALFITFSSSLAVCLFVACSSITSGCATCMIGGICTGCSSGLVLNTGVSPYVCACTYARDGCLPCSRCAAVLLCCCRRCLLLIALICSSSLLLYVACGNHCSTCGMIGSYFQCTQCNTGYGISSDSVNCLRTPVLSVLSCWCCCCCFLINCCYAVILLFLLQVRLRGSFSFPHSICVGVVHVHRVRC